MATGTRRFIAAGEAHAFPLGTVDTFGTYFAPADFNETVNTLGQPLYAKQEPRKFERGTDCTRSPTRCRCAIARACWSSWCETCGPWATAPRSAPSSLGCKPMAITRSASGFCWR
jgi:hypothetical protein